MKTACVTINELLLEALVFVLICWIIYWKDLAKVKNPYDDQKKTFVWKRDYWRFRYDDMAIKWGFAFLGAILGGEIGHPAVQHFIPLPDIADKLTDLTLVAVSSFYASKIFAKDDD